MVQGQICTKEEEEVSVTVYDPSCQRKNALEGFLFSFMLSLGSQKNSLPCDQPYTL